jgi:hypothetical protein
MATYGRGQMLGSGINPESFKQDYSGFANAAATQAQGVANLGASIGGAIKEFGEAKKEQKKVDAYNKASAKAIEAAITLGDSYGIKGARETLSPFLSAANDPNLSPIEKAALLDEAKAMIPNVFGRFDKSEAIRIEQAAMNARGSGGDRAVNLQQGEVIETINGKQYKVPVTFDPVTGERRRPDGTIVGAPMSAGGASPAAGISSALNLPARPVAGGLRAQANAINNATKLPSSPIYTDDTSQLPPLDDGIANEGSILLPLEGTQPNLSSPVPASFGNTPATTVDNTALAATQVPSYAIPLEVDKETYEQNVEAGGLFGQRNTKTGEFKAYPGQTGGRITKFNPETGQFEIIEGSAAGGSKAKKVAEAERSSKFQETRQTNFIIDKANEAENIIDNSISTYGAGTIIDIAKSQMPGTQEYKLKNQIFPALKDSIALDSLKQLKAASPTGSSGLGSLTEKEGNRLENMYGVLDINGDKVTLKNDLKRLKQTAFDYIHGSKDEREKALQKGDITKDQNDQVEKMYREQILGVDASKSKEIQPIIPSSDSESLYKRYLQK